MRILTLAVLFMLPTVAFAQAPAVKPDSKATLSAAELEMMTDSVTQLDKAAQDMQSARLFMDGATAKQERAAILIEARKLKILNARGYSDEAYEVVYVTDGVNSKTPGYWVVREKPKEKPKP